MHFERTDGGAVVNPGSFSCSQRNQQETLDFVLEPPPKFEIIGMWPLWISDTPETGIPRFLAAGFDSLEDSDGFDHSRTELGSACDLVQHVGRHVDIFCLRL